MSGSRAAFLKALREGCLQCHLRNAPILVAVSGGADSVALLRGLTLLNAELNCQFQVAHLDHGLRGSESDADADWVDALSQQLGLPCRLGKISVGDLPEVTKLGTEGAARLARRRFLQQTARERHCVAIAVAHTASDQAETILHHILRGTGIAGLRGMKSPKVPTVEELSRNLEIPIVRPMLDIERASVEQFLLELPQSWRTDSTNSDTNFTRNRIRHDLLPQLAREFNPNIQDALLRLGEQAREVYSQQIDLADQLLQTALIEATNTHCRIRCSSLTGHTPHQIREAFVQLWRRQDWPRRPMGFEDWQRLVQMLEPDAPAMTLPGDIQVRQRSGLLMLMRRAPSGS